MTKIGLITARGASKGIPRKNIKMLNGKPLIQWTIEAALKAFCIDRVIVSTDDDEIASIALKCQAEVPFIRPKEYSTDTASSIDVVLHALNEIPGATEVFLLQPTSPLRTYEDINAIFSLRESTGASSAVSVTPVKKPPEWMYKVTGNKMKSYTSNVHSLRRQEQEPIYLLNGAIYLAKREHIENQKKFIDKDTFPYVMSQERSIDIDTMIDWHLAEVILEKNRNYC